MKSLKKLALSLSAILVSGLSISNPVSASHKNVGAVVCLRTPGYDGGDSAVQITYYDDTSKQYKFKYLDGGWAGSEERMDVTEFESKIKKSGRC